MEFQVWLRVLKAQKTWAGASRERGENPGQGIVVSKVKVKVAGTAVRTAVVRTLHLLGLIVAVVEEEKEMLEDGEVVEREEVVKAMAGGAAGILVLGVHVVVLQVHLQAGVQVWGVKLAVQGLLQLEAFPLFSVFVVHVPHLIQPLSSARMARNCCKCYGFQDGFAHDCSCCFSHCMRAVSPTPNRSVR